MKNSFMLALFIALGFAIAGFAIAEEGKDESGQGHRPKKEYRQEGRRLLFSTPWL
jgi:hypothetical protein